MTGTSRAQLPRVASSGPAPAHGPTPAPERTQGHTRGDRRSRPDRGADQCPGGADSDPDERVRGHFARLAAAHSELAHVYADLAEDRDIQLAGSPAPRLMVDVDAAIEPSAPLLAVAGLARLLDVTEKTVRRWRDEGRLPDAVEVGGVVRWRPEDIDRWLAEGGER